MTILGLHQGKGKQQKEFLNLETTKVVDGPAASFGTSGRENFSDPICITLFCAFHFSWKKGIKMLLRKRKHQERGGNNN
jgi:hypothetical protein